MVLAGNLRLVQRGYSPEHLAYVDALAAEQGIAFSFGEEGIRAVKSGHGIAAPVELLRSAGMSGRAVSAGETYEVYTSGEPSVKTSLTENEVIFPLPPASERGVAGSISFNPIKALESVKRRPNEPVEAQVLQGKKQVGTFLIRPVFPGEREGIINKVMRGQNIEFWRFRGADFNAPGIQAKPKPIEDKLPTDYAPFGKFRAKPAPLVQPQGITFRDVFGSVPIPFLGENILRTFDMAGRVRKIINKGGK